MWEHLLISATCTHFCIGTCALVTTLYIVCYTAAIQFSEIYVCSMPHAYIDLINYSILQAACTVKRVKIFKFFENLLKIMIVTAIQFKNFPVCYEYGQARDGSRIF